MPFLFVYVCDLLDRLERLHLRDVPYLPNHFKSTAREMTIEWFKLHRHRLNHFNTSDQAVLSMLEPEKQTDRVYGLDLDRLELIIARVLSLPREHYSELQTWRKEPLRGDLAVCVKRVMENCKTFTYRSQTNSVTVEEIDQALLRIAAFNSGSSEAVKSLAKNWDHPDAIQVLGRLYMKLQGREAKWLTRFILKNYGPVKLPRDLALASNDSSLPNCLQVSIQLPTPKSSAVHIEGTGIVRGIGDIQVTQPFTPMPVAIATKWPITPSTSIFQQSSSALAPSKASKLPPPKILVPKPSSAPYPSQPSSSRPALAPLSSSSQNSQNLQQQNSQKNQATGETQYVTLASGSASCQMNSQDCPLRQCVFILSPCVSGSAYMRNLLSWHGVCYNSSLSNFRPSKYPRQCPKTNKRYRLVILVESHHAKKTVDFLKKVMKLKSKHQGDWERVQVYDWRLLESISKFETGKKLTHDPWERLWMLDI